MKCIKILPSSFCLPIWFMEKYWIWVTNELLSFYAGNFMNEIFHAYFSLTVKIFYHFFYHISDSLQISSTFKFICFKMQRKKSFCLVQYILCYRNPPIKQTCWQWLAEAQLFRHDFDYQGLINAFLQVEKHSRCINKIQRIQYFEIITGECFD